jgi:hypothetical protein
VLAEVNPELRGFEADPLAVAALKEQEATTREVTALGMAQWLEGCGAEQVIYAATGVEGLYAKAAFRHDFGPKEVDVFARGAVYALGRLGTPEATAVKTQIERARDIVFRQTHITPPAFDTKFGQLTD